MRSIFTRFLFLFVVLASAFGQDYTNLDTDIKGSRLPSFGVDSGSANAYVVTTVAPLGPGLRTGSSFQFVAVNANTGASTLNADGTGAIAIRKLGATVLAGGDIPAGAMVTAVYDGTYYQMQGVLPTAGTSGSGSGCSTGLPGSVCAYYPNDTSVGTSLNHTVRFIDAGINHKKVRDFSNSDPVGWGSGLVGICQSGCGTSGLAEICVAGECLCDMDGASNQGDFVDLGIDASSAPKCTANSAAGLNEDPSAHTFFAKVRTTIGSAGVATVDMLSFLGYSNAYGGDFGGGNFAVICCGGQHATVSPFYLVTTPSPASVTNPFMAVHPGSGLIFKEGFGYFTSLYEGDNSYTSGGTMDAELFFDTTWQSGSGRAIRMACEGCSAGQKSTAHYTPPYTITMSGSGALPDTLADTFNITLAGNLTITYYNIIPGHVTNWNICQDATGGRTFSLSGASGGGFSPAPTITSTANACTTFSALTLGTEAVPTLLMLGGTGGGGGGISTPVSVANGGTGTGGTLTGIVRGSATAMTAAELSGDCTTSGSNAVTCSKINGGSMPASAKVLGSNSSSQPVAATAADIAGPLTCADATGSTTAYTCSTTPTFTPAAKTCIWFTPQTTNTGASTLNVNSTSAAAIQKWLGTAVASGDMPGGKTIPACFDGTNWQVMNIGNAPSGGGSGYTTVQSNGSAVTARSTINLISGTNTTVSCVDNSGASKTDCTVSGGTTVPLIPSNGSNTENGNTAVISVPINPFSHAGDLFITFCPDWSSNVGTTMTTTDTQVNTWTVLGNTGNNTSDFQSESWVSYATAQAAGDTITCTSNGGNGHLGMAALEISGTATVDQSAFGNNNSAATGVTLSFTTTSTDTLLVFIYDADRSSADTFTGLSGYTALLAGTGSSGIYYKVYSKTRVAAGAQSITVTGASTHPIHVAFVALK